MKAIIINKADHSLNYTDVPNPVLKDGEIIIETYAAALNRADLLQREGSYPPPPGCPEWPGLEVDLETEALIERCLNAACGINSDYKGKICL